MPALVTDIFQGICAGKHSIQDYLVQKHGFQPLVISQDTAKLSTETLHFNSIEPIANGTEATTKFSSVQDLLDFATNNWQSNYVTTSIHNESIVESLSHRPFFILVHVDAPLSIRFQRFRSRYKAACLPLSSLETFVVYNDHDFYSPSTGLAAVASRAQIKLINNTASLAQLHAHLDTLNLTDSTRLRPTWDHYFMTLASLAARRSNCMRRQVGCVLVRAARVISTGYNGTPRNVTNCNEGGCPRCNNSAGVSNAGGSALSTCLCIHAEENALLEAGRERIGGGAVLYCNTCPCLTCTIKIVQVGIAEVVYSRSYYMDAEAAQIFQEAGVKLRQFSPPTEGAVITGDDNMAGMSLDTFADMMAVHPKLLNGE